MFLSFRHIEQVRYKVPAGRNRHTAHRTNPLYPWSAYRKTVRTARYGNPLLRHAHRPPYPGHNILTLYKRRTAERTIHERVILRSFCNRFFFAMQTNKIPQCKDDDNYSSSHKNIIEHIIKYTASGENCVQKHSAVETHLFFYYYIYMNIIVVGSGGREHAVCWKLAQSPLVEKIIVVPGNGGTAKETKCKNVDPASCDYLEDNGTSSYVQIARHEECIMAIIGPEDPLAEGIADVFWQADIPCIGPKKAGAQLEASKDLAKSFMRKYGVACAASKTFTDETKAKEYIQKHGAPVVIKADGLAAGKGVTVAATVDEALDAVTDIMDSGRVGDAGKKLVIEDYLAGREMSVLAAVSVTPETAKNGKAAIIPFLPARDHKRLNDGAKGPNTGGMGAVCPLSDVTPEIMEQFKKNILQPTLRGLIAEKFDYRGFIFFGVMITKDGPKLLEYNVRLGDPETQAVLPLMDFDFAGMCCSIINGTLSRFMFKWKSGFVVAPCIVSGGYPGKYEKGKKVSLIPALFEKTGAKIFIAGAQLDRRSSSADPYTTGLMTSGGRVLACSTYGDTFKDAWTRAYQAVSAISFDGAFHRNDIGLPGAAESGAL
jgi:phosphoribosylamine---glycine ligase